MLFRDGQLREKYRSLSPNSLRILAWQEDQYERPLRVARQEKKRKMADRGESFNGVMIGSSNSSSSRGRRSGSPRKRTKPSYDEFDEESASDEDIEVLDPTLTQDAFSTAIPPKPQPVPNLRNTAPIQQISPSLSRSSRTSPTRRSRSTTTYSRTPSPSKGGLRQKRIALEFTTPKFYSGLPERPSGNTVDELDEMEGSTSPDPKTQFEVPAHITTLIRDLSETAATAGCIPADLEGAIQSASQGTEAIPAEVYSPDRAHGIITSAHLLRAAQDVHAAALKAYKSHRDEQAWYPIVRAMLDSPVPSTFLEVDESQTRSVCSELLPLAGMARLPIAGVKTDMVLQFNRDHERVAKVLNPVFLRDPAANLSAFNDPVAAKTFTVALVEVKSPAGDYDEGVYQLTVASAAVLARLRLLEIEGGLGGWEDLRTRDWAGADPEKEREKGKCEMPILGWVVHGHFWYLHVTYRQFDGSIRILGPFPSGNTATYLGIFRLIRIMSKVKHWVAASYWPYLRSLVEARSRLATVPGFAESLPPG